jgi:hypothetical protein
MDVDEQRAQRAGGPVRPVQEGAYLSGAGAAVVVAAYAVLVLITVGYICSVQLGF